MMVEFVIDRVVQHEHRAQGLYYVTFPLIVQ